jgi:hypothetical protein
VVFSGRRTGLSGRITSACQRATAAIARRNMCL